ncbi:MAG: crossover junction endodeoxyribonuclease RuvC [Patescibacteria group bacterium]
MRIIGIDPGIERTGIGIIDIRASEASLVFVDCITTLKTHTQQERLLELKNEFVRILKKYKPQQAAIEKLFFSTNVKTAMRVSEARGVLLTELQQAKIPTSEWTPQQIKQRVTGYGKADKQQIQKLVCAILKLTVVPKPDDATDALAVALTAH